MINLRGVSIYKKNNLILNNVSENLKGKVVIVGLNNSGKTQFIEALCGKAKIETGVIELNEEFVIKNEINKNNNGFVYVPKNYNRFLESLKVKDIRKFFVKKEKEYTAIIREGDITEETKFSQLNYIQKLILFIDIGLKQEKKIFIFDEPCLNLDINEKAIFQKIISSYLMNLTIISTSNNPYESVFQEFDRMLFIHQKKLQEKSPYL